MDIMLQFILAVLLMAVAFHAQWRLSSFVKPGPKLLFIRVLLALAGIGFGATAWALQADPGMLTFLIGFGLVHVPAACILYIKRMRGEGRS